jgi:hypothetical protein
MAGRLPPAARPLIVPPAKTPGACPQHDAELF